MNAFKVDGSHLGEEGLSNPGVPEQPGLITRPPKKVLQYRTGIATSIVEESFNHKYLITQKQG
jgi:hypothetical protein